MASIYDELLATDARLADAAVQIPAPLPQPDQAPAPSVYDTLLAQDNQAIAQATDHMLNRLVNANPDRSAREQELSKNTRLPLDLVQRNFETVDRQDKVRRIQNALRHSPVLRRQVTDPKFAALAHDDIDTLTKIEKAVGTGVRYVMGADDTHTVFGDLGSFWHSANQGAAGAFRGLLEFATPTLDWAVDGNDNNPVRNLGGWFSRAAHYSKQRVQELSPPRESLIGRGIYSGVQSIFHNAPLLAMSLATGNPNVTLTGMSAMAGGSSYHEGRQQGLTPVQTLPYAVSQGTIEFVTEKIPASRLLGDILKNSGFWKTLNRQWLPEITGEQIATVAQDLNDWAVLPENKNKPFTDYLKERPSAAAETLIATIVGVGGNVAIMRGIDRAMTTAEERQARAQATQAHAQFLENLTQLVQADKLVQRDPETFERFIAQAAEDGPVTHVYVEAETLMQSGVAEALAQVSHAIAQQLPIAAQTGGQIAIPVEEYAARIAPLEQSAAILDHLKTEPEGFSRQEAQTYMQEHGQVLEAHVEKALAEAEADDAFKASAQTVRESVKAQLDTADRFTPQVNEAYAAMVSNAYAVQAAKVGVTPEALFAQYPLRVVAEGVAGQQFDQSLDTPEFKAWFEDSKVVDSEGNPLVVYHGTGANFDTFDRAKGKRANLSDGFYFAVKPEDANAFAKRSTFNSEGGNLMPVYVSLKNPAIVRGADTGAERAGHDGLIQVDDAGNIKTVVAFRAEQVKSAIGNRGTFDANDPSILRQDGQPVATLTGEEIAPRDADIKTLRAATKQWYETNLRGKKIVNRASGREIEFRNARKAFNSSANPDKLRLFAALDQIMAEGEIKGSRPPDNPSSEQSTRAYHWLEADVLLDGEPTRVGVTLREDDKGNLYYNHNPIEKAPNSPVRTAPPHKGGGIYGQGAYRETIPPSADDVNLEIVSQGDSTPRGQFNPSTNTIALLKNADLSTFLHESGHFFLEMQVDLASRPDAPAAIRQDMQTTLDWFGVRDLTEWHGLNFEQKRAYHEQFARGFEAYLFEGKSPSIEMQGLFQRFRAWLLHVYRDLKALNVELTDQVRAVFDRLLATQEQIALAEQAQSMLPLFESAEQAGLTPEEFAAYQALGVQATAQAQDELQTKGARDMLWMRNIHTRVLKDLQKQAAFRRREIRIQARREVMQQPIYRAWQFLAGKITPDDRLATHAKQANDPNHVDPTQDSLFTSIAKLGGVNRSEVQKLWGIDPKESVNTPVFGKPVLRAKGGMTLDEMGEALVQDGYLTPDENGLHDPRELEEKFFAELGGSPVYAIRFDYDAAQEMRAGDQLVNPGALGAGRLALDELRAMGLPGHIVEMLKARRMTAREGLHPDIVADLFGFTSGDELARNLAAADSPSEVIEAMTELRMLQEHGELSSPEALARAADAAVHNAVRARFVATEMNALAKATGRPRVLTSAARQLAATIVARQRVRDIRPGQYTRAAAKAAQKAEKALKQKALPLAASEKRNQLVQQYAARAAHDALSEVERGVRYLKNFDSPTSRKRIDPDYHDQIDKLLERFDLRSGQSLKRIDRRTSLAAWLESQREQGIEPSVPEWLEAETDRQHYKNLTLEEFRGLVDTVKQIEHLGRLKNRMLTDQRKRALDDVVQELHESIIGNAHGRVVDNAERNTLGSKTTHLWRGAMAIHRKFANTVREMDGFQDGGPLWEALVRTMNAAGDKEASMRADAARRLYELSKPVIAQGRTGGKGVFFPTLGISLNRGEILAIALNLGNDGNRQRLLDGRNWMSTHVQPALDTLTAADWHFVQGVWDFFGSYRPEIAAKERRVTGVEPQWVEPVPFTVTSADGQELSLSGGYYPIRYDTYQSGKAYAHDAAEQAKALLRGAYTSATTRRSFTKARVEEVKGQAVALSFDGIYRGANEVIHDLAWHEWLIDANRLMRRLDSPMRTHYGAETVQAIQAAIKDIAVGDAPAANVFETGLNHLRTGATVAGLGWNVFTALLQPLGITQSIARVGPAWIARGLRDFYGTPAHMLAKAKEVNAQSAFMANRAQTMNREIHDVRNRLTTGKGPIRTAAEASFFVLIQKMQMTVDYPTWLAAYARAEADPKNILPDGQPDTARLVALADQAVIDTQGGGQIKDLAQVQRGHPALKLFTNFYSFFNVAFNMMYDAKARTDFKKPADVMRLAGDYLLILVLPAVLGASLRYAMKGDDDDDFVDALLEEQIDYLMGLMVGLREVSAAVKKATGVGKPFGYQGPAGLRFFAELDRLGQQVGQGELDAALLKAVNNVGGILLHYPAGQLQRTVQGAAALFEGRTQNPAALVNGFR